MSRYRPGDWALPRWWTDPPLARGRRMTHREQHDFYNGQFVREVLGHTGGMTKLPKTRREMDEINGLRIPECLTCGAHEWVDCTCTGIREKHRDYWNDRRVSWLVRLTRFVARAGRNRRELRAQTDSVFTPVRPGKH